MKKPKSNPTTPEPDTADVASAPASVVEPPHDQIKAKRMTEAEYTSRMKYTIIGSPGPARALFAHFAD